MLKLRAESTKCTTGKTEYSNIAANAIDPIVAAQMWTKYKYHVRNVGYPKRSLISFCLQRTGCQPKPDYHHRTADQKHE